MFIIDPDKSVRENEHKKKQILLSHPLRGRADTILGFLYDHK